MPTKQTSRVGLLYFVTPAFQRYELTDVCLRQRRELCDWIADSLKFEARCVVIADDDNVGIAHDHGHEVAIAGNESLGLRFSLGYLHALEHGATHVLPIGSDSWMAPGIVAELAAASGRPGEIVGTRRLASLRPDGLERYDMTIFYPHGPGVATMYPRESMSGKRWPCPIDLKRGCDGATWRKCGGGYRLVTVEHDPLEYTDFKSPDVQTTDYGRLIARWSEGARVDRGSLAIGRLEDAYPGHLVARLREIYGSRA